MLAACIALSFAPVASAAPEEGFVEIARRGAKPVFAVSIPAEPSPTEAYAAEEFARLAEKISGVALPVVREDRAGASARKRVVRIETDPAFGESEYRLRSSGGRVVLAGGKRGVLFAVYDLFERYGGAGWYSSWREVVPEADRFRVPDGLDDFQKPAFELREDYWFDAFDGDYAARNRLDGDMMRFGEKHGGRSKMRFCDGLGNAHTFRKLVPPGEFFDSHPEYFSEIGGERVGRDSQLCLSNPEVLSIVVERVKKAIRDDPSARYVGVSQNDNMNYCRCEKCAAIDAEEGSHAGSVARFVNAVADEIAKEFPDKVISTLAYQYSLKPPAKTRLRPNVMPVVCSYGCCYSTPMTDPGAGEQEKSFLRDLSGWGAQTDMLYVWDYHTNFRHYMLPFPNVRSLRENLRTFRDSGVTCVFAEGAYQGRHGEFAELKAWLTAKWLWNPDLEADPLIDRFMKGYYGAAAPFVREYFDMLEAARPRRLGIADDEVPWLDDESLVKATALWAKALAAVKDDKECAYNVRMGMFPVVYARQLRRMRTVQKRWWLCADVSRFASETSRKPVDWMLARMKEAGDIVLSEYFSNAQALAEWERFASLRIPDAGSEKLTWQESDVDLAAPFERCGEIVDDPDAQGGKAYRIFPTHAKWCVARGFKDVAFDELEGYRVRARVKIVLKPGAAEKYGSMEAAAMGVCDEKCGKNAGLQILVKDVKRQDYAWYAFKMKFVPEAHQYFWFAPGAFDMDSLKEHPAVESVSFDCVEVMRPAGR